MFSFFLTPIGRYGILIMVGISLCMYGIHRIKEQAVAEAEAAAIADALRRTNRAVNAGDAIDTSPERVRDSDGHKRD